MILHVNAQQDLFLGRLTTVALPVHFADPGGSKCQSDPFLIRQRNVGAHVLRNVTSSPDTTR